MLLYSIELQKDQIEWNTTRATVVLHIWYIEM